MTTPIERIERALGRRPAALSRLSGGCIAEVYRAEFGPGGGPPVVVKVDGSRGARLDCEGFMLGYLAERSALPVPRVIVSEPSLLVMEHIDAGEGITPSAERHAAELLAALHAVTPPPDAAGRFGLCRDTLIGPLDQPNPWTERWVDFFAEHRLVFMARRARGSGGSGGISGSIAARVEHLASRLGELIDEPAQPSLIHGDIWSGNVLCRGGRVAAFIDPAIAYAHAEQELAFTTLFSTFGRAFFDRYRELRPIAPGFDDGRRARRDVYNLYPLLVHAALFGGHYGAEVDSTLRRFEF